MAGEFMLVGLPVAVSLAAVSTPLRADVRAPATDPRTATQELLTLEATPARADIAVRRVKLEAAPAVETAPAVRVTFELANENERSLVDLVVAISLTVPPKKDPLSKPRIVAGPLVLRLNGPVLPGYSVAYDIVLRNVSASQCACVPSVTVLDAQEESP